jgi:hypothetical protein
MLESRQANGLAINCSIPGVDALRYSVTFTRLADSDAA